MATEKVSLSLDSKALREARKKVGRGGLSGYVDDALRVKLQHDRLRTLLAEFEAERGPIPDEIMDEVRREWPLDEEPPATRKSRRRSRRA